MMKRSLILIVFMVITTVFISCSEKTDEPAIDKTLTVKLAKLSGSKAIGAPAETGKVSLRSGLIFILDRDKVLDVAEIIPGKGENGIESTTGQVFPRKVNKGTQVYIVGNLPAELFTRWKSQAPKTLTAIHAELFDISSAESQDYSLAPLSNKSGSPETITLTTEKSAEVKITINPIYARVELVQVEGLDSDPDADPDNTITSFDVTGVFMTDYYDKYLLNGVAGGTFYEQADDFSKVLPVMKNEGKWSSENRIAKPDALNTGVWGYNTPAGTPIPRIIVRLEKVVGKQYGANIDDTQVYYVTLSGYSKDGEPIEKFERGKVYRVGSLKFNCNHFKTKPNDDKVDLVVIVTVEDWVVVDVDGDI